MKWDDAAEIAQGIARALRPHAEPDQLLIAGSIRRRKPEVKDVEIVVGCRPTVKPGLFANADDVEFVAVEKFVEAATAARHRKPSTEFLTFDPELKRNGPRYKRLRFYRYLGSKLDATIAIDLFIVIPPAQFGVQLAIRTGPAEFSRRLVTRRDAGGPLPAGYFVRDGALHGADGNPIATPTERSFFEAIGIPYTPPWERSLDRLVELQAVTQIQPGKD